ncbi:M16 family metallopeptidase [Caenimonas sedimenti]|uniref:M16 family metallopeptidase n=1 Tax=Caenimonas sedimenti TaxID=2596921 RepID=UPI00210277FA|nr:pitrilysin family protein [Caenimonas sedimenti]
MSFPSLDLSANASASPQLHTLANGLTLLAVPMPQVASASVAIFIRAGSRDEAPAQAGVSHFLEHMAFKGTHTRTVQAINFAAESLGADMNAYTDKDATCYYLEGLGAHTPQMLELLADIVLESTFPADELEREREVILQECTEYDEDPQQLSYTLLDQALWGEHPMGRPIIGIPATIAAISRDDVVDHVRKHYVADRIVVAAAGNFDVDAFFSQAEKRFAHVPGAARYSAPETPGHVGQTKAKRLPGVSQTYITIAWPIASRGTHPHLASLAATLFGGGMSAPLVDAVRERLGLAYSVGATADVGDVHGALVVDATTTPDKVPAFTQELARLLAAQAQTIAASDLARARNQLLVSLVRSSERPLRLLQRCVEHLWASGAAFDLRAAIASVQAIEAETVRQAFESLLAHPAATVLVGAGATAKAARDFQAKLRVS